MTSKFHPSKIAIVHDVLLERGGAERFLLVLTGMLPTADVYTLYFNKRDTWLAKNFSSRIKGTSFLQYIPYLEKAGLYFSIFKLFSNFYFYFMNLTKYDLVISSSHSYNSKAVRVGKNGFHISYIHTPPRYLYGLENEISPENIVYGGIFNIIKFFLRIVDKKSATRPDILIANSREVADRIKKFYGRDAYVINPPVFLPKISAHKRMSGKKYYVAHSRLVKQKGIDLVVKTCKMYDLPLVVIGKGPEMTKLKKMAGRRTKFLGEINDHKIAEVYSGAIALLYCAKQEDFGIVPVEAMSFGVPVVAFKSGGVKETVTDGHSGVLFNNYSPKGLNMAIQRLKQIKISSSDCKNQAQNYSVTNFAKRFADLLQL